MNTNDNKTLFVGGAIKYPQKFGGNLSYTIPKGLKGTSNNQMNTICESINKRYILYIVQR